MPSKHAILLAAHICKKKQATEEIAAYLIDFLEDFLQFFFARSEAHGAKNVVEVVGTEELLLLGVEEVEADFEHLDLIHLERSGLLDFIEVDVGKVGLRHARRSC